MSINRHGLLAHRAVMFQDQRIPVLDAKPRHPNHVEIRTRERAFTVDRWWWENPGIGLNPKIYNEGVLTIAREDRAA